MTTIIEHRAPGTLEATERSVVGLTRLGAWAGVAPRSLTGVVGLRRQALGVGLDEGVVGSVLAPQPALFELVDRPPGSESVRRALRWCQGFHGGSYLAGEWLTVTDADESFAGCG